MAIQQREIVISDDADDARIRIYPGGEVVSITMWFADGSTNRIVMTTEMFKRIAARIDEATTEVL